MRLTTSLVLALSVGVAGCVAPYTVRRQTQPNPFLSQSTFALLPLDFSRATPPAESDGMPWSERNIREFEKDKIALQKAFQRELVGQLGEHGIRVIPVASGSPASAPFVIQPKVHGITPGDYTGVGGNASDVRLRVAILTRGGQLLDEVDVEHGTIGDPMAGTTERRLALDGAVIAERLASYLHERVAPGSELQ